jgi:uncharacterized protein
MRIRRRAAAEKTQRLLRDDGVPRAWRNEGRIAGNNAPPFTVDLHLARAFEDEIKLLGQLVMMPLRRAARRDTRLGEALVGDRRIRPVKNAADGGSVPRGKRGLLGEIMNNHTLRTYMEYYNGCTALITGASSGLGREFAFQLAPHAGRLVLVARRLDRLNELRGELLAEFPDLEIFSYGMDLADTARIDEMVRWLDDNGLQIDFLVNNAGLGDYGPFETSDWAKVKQMLDVNIGALTKLTHSLLPVLRRERSGAILNVGSVAGMIPIPHEAVYAATKAYVASFTESLRAELRQSGVSVTQVCPGPVDTEFSEVALRDQHGLMSSPEFFKVSAAQVVHRALMGVAEGRARVIPGWVVASIMCVAASVPLFVLRYFMNRLLDRKED